MMLLWFLLIVSLLFVESLTLLAVLITILSGVVLIINVIRRFHDTGRSGLYMFLIFVPLLGIFLPVYLMIEPGEKEANEWGYLKHRS